MNWGQEGFDRLIYAQQNQPDPHELDAIRAEQQRIAENAKIKRRLPKVA